MDKFEEFINVSNLLEIKMMGKKFTWYRPDGTCKSKLDRLLVNVEWRNKWPAQTLRGGGRTLSDHRPIFIEERAKDWGPKPFKIGWSAYRLKEKLKALKFDIKEWIKGHVGNLETDIANMSEEIGKLDAIDDTLGLEEEEISERNNLMKKLSTAMNRKEAELIQKAKIGWAKEGDLNSALFHKVINMRSKRNSIDGLWAHGEWKESVQEVEV
ncbi:hypothetical protein ACS0TY_032664 [Phlomoides rotata]